MPTKVTSKRDFLSENGWTHITNQSTLVVQKLVLGQDKKNKNVIFNTNSIIA